MTTFSRVSGYAALLFFVALTAPAAEAKRSAAAADLSPGELIELLVSVDSVAALWGDLVVFDGEQLTAFELSRSGTLHALDAPEKAAVEAPGSALALLLDFPAHATMNAAAVYALSTCPERLVSGLAAACVEVKPHDIHRHGYRVWMDPAVPAVVAVSVHAAAGPLLESARFVRARPGRVRTAVIAASPMPGPPPELPRWLPSGFSVRSFGVSVNETVVRFSDGVAAFTLYITPVEDKPTETGTTRRGASVVVDRLTTTQGKPAKMMTLAGEIPVATARRILVGAHGGTSVGTGP
jgi:hypothetical protein